MTVKEKYSHLSTQVFYEWSLLNPTRYNFTKRHAYAFWESIKELDVNDLTFDDVVRLDKINEMHYNELKAPRYRRK